MAPTAKRPAKIDPRLDAIRYQEMLKRVGAQKRSTEAQAKEAIDRLAKLVAALRPMGGGGDAETELDKANAALKEKDWTSAYGAAQQGLQQGEEVAKEAADRALDAGVSLMYDVERIGALVDELQPLAAEGRALRDEAKYLDQYRKGQELRAKAMQTGREHLDESIQSLSELMAREREEGVDTRSPEAILEKARSMLSGADVDFAQVFEMVAFQAPAAREAALRGEPAGVVGVDTPTVGVQVEDREALARAVEEAFRRAETEIKEAQALRADVQAADRELARGKSAFDAGDLKGARAAARRSIIASSGAARRAVGAELEDAAAEVRKLRLAGANVTEVRKMLATAKLRVAEGSYGEASLLLKDLVTRATTLREQQTEVLQEVESTQASLSKITTMGVVPSDAAEPLEEARNYARRGDVERARAALRRAEQSGREFWTQVVDHVLRQMRDFVLEARDEGAQIHQTRALFQKGKQALDAGDTEGALRHIFDAVRTIQGAPDNYHEALNQAAEKYLLIEVAGRLGIARPQDIKALRESSTLRSPRSGGNPKPSEAYSKDLAEHRKVLDEIVYDFPAEQEKFVRAIRRTLELENEVEEGKKIGTDMNRAEELLFDARSELSKHRLDRADIVLKEIGEDIVARKDERIEELLKDADADLKNMRATGVHLDDVAREVREARSQHANRNYEIAVDLIQDAVTTALERQGDLEAARREIQRAESLAELGADYAADTGLAAGLLDESRSALRDNDYWQARAVASQAVGEAQVALSPYIDLILEETERTVDKAEAEHGMFPEWRERLNESARLREQGDVGEAILVARSVSSSIQTAADTIHEVRQKITLVESYMAWVGQYTKTVVMPHKLLEHAKERLENFSLEAAREAVNEAVQKAEEAQRQFLREVHEEAFELLDEYELRGMQLIEGRNIMMQAQGMLESKAFEESYKSAVAAQDFARKAYDMFQQTQRAVGELETEVQRMETYGIDVSALTSLLEQASSDFEQEKYEQANAALARGQAMVPDLKRARTQALEDELREVLGGAAGVRGVNVKKFEEALAHCLETRESGDIGLAIEMLAETKRDLEASLELGGQVAGLLGLAKQRLDQLKAAQMETRSLEDAHAIAERRLDAQELPEAASILKRALLQAEKSLKLAAEEKLESVLSQAIELRLSGLAGESALPAIEEAADALLAGDFASATRAATGASQELETVRGRTDRLLAGATRGRVCAARLKEAGASPAEDLAALEAAMQRLGTGDLAGAEEDVFAAAGRLGGALSQLVSERVAALEADLDAADEEGADTAAARDALRHARTALEEAVPEGADHWAHATARLTGQARENSSRAADAMAQAERLLADAEAFGADPQGIAAAVGELKQAMEGRRHKRALELLSKAQEAWREAKKARFDGRKSSVVEAMQRAAKLGVPQQEPRARLAAIEKDAAGGRFEAAFEALDALDKDLSKSLARRDGLAGQFEEANDVETAFSDLPVDFSTCREARLKARDALERFALDDAEQLISSYRKTVEDVLTEHGAKRVQALRDAVEKARLGGMAVPEAERDAEQAQAAFEASGWREVEDLVERGHEHIEESRKRLDEVHQIAGAARSLLSKAGPLGADMAEVEAALSTMEAKLQEGALEEAKVEADYALKSVRNQVATEADRRAEEAATRLEGAAAAGIVVEPERGALRKAKEAAEAEDFAKFVQALDLIERSLTAKTAERDRALEALQKVRGRLAQLEAFEVPVDEFRKEGEALDRLEDAHDFKKLLPLVGEVERKLATRLKERVDAALSDTAGALGLSSKSQIYVGDAPRALERARKLAAAGDYIEAYRAARQAERAAYESKDRHDRAKQVLRNVDDHLSIAASMSVDTADLEAIRTQALDAFEFQSYDEATSIGMDAHAKVVERLKGVLNERLGRASSRLDSLELAGAAISTSRRELDLAQGLIENDDLISAEVALGGTERRIEAAAEAFAATREVVERLTALIDVADLLGVDAKAARSAAEAVEGHFRAGDYARAQGGARTARAQLATGCAAEVEKRIEAARDVLRALEASGIPIGPATAPVDLATDALLEEDFVGAFSAAREAMERAEKQRRAFEAAREAIKAARRRLRIAEGLEAESAPGREALSESEILFRSGDYEASATAAANSAVALASAAADTASLAISQAERSLDEFSQTGVLFPPAADCLSRSREALALEDFLGSVHYARMAAQRTGEARRQVEEAQSVLSAYARSLERAEGVLPLEPKDREALEEATREFEGGQMRRAQDLVLEQQQALHGRARAAHAAVTAEVLALADGLERMGFDAGAARNEAKESALAVEEGRIMDALGGVVAARTFARDQLAERVGGRGQELEALVVEFENGGIDVGGAREALERFAVAAQALDATAAAEAEAAVRGVALKALEAQAATVVKGLQRAGEQRYFRTGAGAKDYAAWRSQAAELRAVLQEKNYAKALTAITGLQAAVQKGLSELLAEKLVEIDAIRETHLPRREATDDERRLYGAVVEAADRGKASLEELDQADKLDAMLRDWASKFVTETKNRINKEMMLFEDKAAVETLKTRLAAIDRARSSPAAALQAAYELVDAAADLFRERADRLIAQARTSVEATAAVGADAAAVQDFLDRAELSLLENNLTEAIDFAESAVKEASRLQEAQVVDVLKRAKQDFEATPEGPVKEEAKRYLQESLQARQSREYEAAYDFGRKSREVMLSSARDAAKPSLDEVAASASALEAEGVDARALREAVQAVEAQFDAWEPGAARERLEKALEEARGKAKALGEAKEATGRLAARVERALGEKVETGKVEARLAAAGEKLRAGDFEAAGKEAAAGSAELDKLMVAKVKALVTAAQAKVKHNRNLEIGSKAAEDLLRNAQKLLQEKDVEGAFDAVTRAIEEADQAKEATKQVRQLGEQGTELLEKAAEAGIPISDEQEKIIFDAAKGKLKADFTVAQLEVFIASVRDQVGAGGPRLELSLTVGEPPIVNRTNNAVLEVENLGDGSADDVEVTFSGEVNVRAREGALGTIDAGDRKSVELQFISRKMGKIPVRVLVSYKDALTGQAKRRSERRWLTLYDATDTQDSEQFFRRDEKCLVCVGAIPPGESSKVCECQSTFHLHCAAGVKECPKCGRRLDES